MYESFEYAKGNEIVCEELFLGKVLENKLFLGYCNKRQRRILKKLYSGLNTSTNLEVRTMNYNCHVSRRESYTTNRNSGMLER